jgi:hypothetical protein
MIVAPPRDPSMRRFRRWRSAASQAAVTDTLFLDLLCAAPPLNADPATMCDLETNARVERLQAAIAPAERRRAEDARVLPLRARG